MGLWSAVCSVASSVVSSVGSAISSAVSSIGGALSSFAATVGPVLGSVLDAFKPVAEALGRFANAFLQGLGILKPDEQIDDIGERALQAAQHGITLEAFDDFDDYMAALRRFEPDPEIAARRSPAEKLVAGLGVGTVGVEDKFEAGRGSLNGLWLLPMTHPAYFTPERMQELVAGGRLGGDIFAYLDKRLSGGEARSLEKNLEVDAGGRPLAPPELDQLYGALDAARAQWAELARQIDARTAPPQGN